MMKAIESTWMNDELRMLNESVSGFFDAELIPNVPRWSEQGHVDREFWTKAGGRARAPRRVDTRGLRRLGRRHLTRLRHLPGGRAHR